MVGNDVVDLRDEDATPERAHRFDARVFCDAELRELDVAPDRARRRWQLWAAKEAVYKLRVKRDRSVVFLPSHFQARLDEAGAPGASVLEGDVRVAGAVSRVVVEERDGAVHAVASDDAACVISGAERLGPDRLDPADPDAPGREARRFATERMARELGVSPGAVEVRKRGRMVT